jgi:hypothetical protein
LLMDASPKFPIYFLKVYSVKSQWRATSFFRIPQHVSRTFDTILRFCLYFIDFIGDKNGH